MDASILVADSDFVGFRSSMGEEFISASSVHFFTRDKQALALIMPGEFIDCM
jgi:hypothetical protein